MQPTPPSKPKNKPPDGPEFHRPAALDALRLLDDRPAWVVGVATVTGALDYTHPPVFTLDQALNHVGSRQSLIVRIDPGGAQTVLYTWDGDRDGWAKVAVSASWREWLTRRKETSR